MELCADTLLVIILSMDHFRQQQDKMLYNVLTHFSAVSSDVRKCFISIKTELHLKIRKCFLTRIVLENQMNAHETLH